MSSERYVYVSGELVRINARSFIFRTEDGEEHVIGRSCVNAFDEEEIAKGVPGMGFEFRIFQWLADKEGMS